MDVSKLTIYIYLLLNRKVKIKLNFSPKIKLLSLNATRLNLQSNHYNHPSMSKHFLSSKFDA